MRLFSIRPAAGVFRLIALAIASWSGVPALAQPMAGGSLVLVGAPAIGGSMWGGTFRLSGAVASAGTETSSGGTFDLTSGLIGLWVTTGGDVSLEIELTPDGRTRIGWAPGATGYQLEAASRLGPVADWQPVRPAPSGNAFIAPPLDTARFFRLRGL